MKLNETKLYYGALFSAAVLLSACGSGTKGTSPTDTFPVDEPLSAALVALGLPLDMAQFFAAAKVSSSCASDTACTLVHTYPNGATRTVTMTATAQQYAPSAAELANAASVVNPVYDSHFAATGVDDSTQPQETRVDLSYFVPSSSLAGAASSKALMASLGQDAAQRMTVARAQEAGNGYQVNWSESGSKGTDVAIGSLLESYKEMGKAAEGVGAAYAVASALSDISTAMQLSQQINGWLSELDALEKCAADPTNPITQSDPGYSANTVAGLQATRAELKQISAVRYVNIMDETAAGLNPVTAVLSIATKQANAWTEETLKGVSEKLMQDARSAVVSCKPTCPVSFAATGISESEINLSWIGSVGKKVVTTYVLFGGNSNGVSTTANAVSDTGLAKSTTYCYTISAYNDYGSAESCPQACGTTFGPPRVTSTNPYAGETKVSINTAVTATFTKVVDAATVNGSTMSLAGGGGAVGGAVSYSGSTATFTPSAPLAYSTTYTGTVTTGVMDLDGRAMEADFTWSFTTEPVPVAGNLTFSINMPGGGLVSSGTATVTWTLAEDLGDVHRYMPSGTVTADITLSDCDPIHTTVPVQATVLGGPGPTLVVYTASNVAFANTYQFGFAADPGTTLIFTCGVDPNRYTLPVAAASVINFAVGVCPSVAIPDGLIPFTTEALLAGTFSCPEMGLSNATWSFAQ